MSAAMLEKKKWKSLKRSGQVERLEEDIDWKMRRLLTKIKYEHRATTLDHSSNTLARDFLTYDRCPFLLVLGLGEAYLLMLQTLNGMLFEFRSFAIDRFPYRLAHR